MVEVKRTQRKRVRRGPSQKIDVSVAMHFWNALAVLVIGSIGCAYILVQRHEQKIIENMAAAATPAVGPSSAKRMLSSKRPFLWYGTAWKEDKTAGYVEQAIEAGFRFIDTAGQPVHYNEAGVGVGWTRAATKFNLDRSDIFLQTKYSPNQNPAKNPPYDVNAPLNEQVLQSVKVSLKNLDTSYIDSLVLHSPLKEMEDTLLVWETMESLVDDGIVKRIGLSNCYSLDDFQTIYRAAKHKPWILQNRFYAQSNFDTEIRQFCKENNILYQSFWTLTANSKALQEPQVHEMARQRDLTPQTLLFAFLMSLGYVTPLSGTKSVKHMEQDVAVMERIQNGERIFETEKDLQQMAELLGMPGL